MKHLALSWAEDRTDDLKDIDFIFHVALNAVETNENIEDIMVEQHKGLKGNDVQPNEIRAILGNQTKKKIVILLDGYDEYKHGTNSDIDHALTKEYLRNCMIILTSRESEHLEMVRDCTDTEYEITGFDQQGIEDYGTKYLGSQEKCRELLEKTEEREISKPFHDYGILHIPIFLEMICFLFLKGVLVLKGKTAILSEVVERCPDWESIRKTGKKHVKSANDAILKLGRLALKGLQQKQFKQIFTKVSDYCFS